MCPDTRTAVADSADLRDWEMLGSSRLQQEVSDHLILDHLIPLSGASVIRPGQERRKVGVKSAPPGENSGQRLLVC